MLPYPENPRLPDRKTRDEPKMLGLLLTAVSRWALTGLEFQMEYFLSNIFLPTHNVASAEREKHSLCYQPQNRVTPHDAPRFDMQEFVLQYRAFRSHKQLQL